MASIIVPTYREAANVESLTTRIFDACARSGVEAELILVDDNSQDGTAEIVQRLTNQFPVRIIVRTTERGLSSAVLRGFAEARFDRLVVLDADLQHPPEMIPSLIARLDAGGCDFVIASRYLRSGGIAGDWPWYRRVISQVATALARPLAPLSDPMSGFFALRRDVWKRAEQLDPIGYKIALELYVKCRCQFPAEVAIRFEKRTAGESKLSWKEEVRYLRHLWRLYGFKHPVPRAAVVVLAGIGLALLAFRFLAAA